MSNQYICRWCGKPTSIEGHICEKENSLWNKISRKLRVHNKKSKTELKGGKK